MVNFKYQVLLHVVVMLLLGYIYTGRNRFFSKLFDKIVIYFILRVCLG